VALPRLVASDKAAPGDVGRMLAALARESGLGGAARTQSFDLAHEPAAGAGAQGGTRKPGRQVHVLAGSVDNGDAVSAAALAAGLKPVRAVVATVEGGRILHLRRLHAR
jgi:hypothetical protein